MAIGVQPPPEVLEDELELLELEELLDVELELLLEELDELDELEDVPELLLDEVLELVELLDELEEELEELLLEDEVEPSWPYRVTMAFPGTLTLTTLFVTFAAVFCQYEPEAEV